MLTQAGSGSVRDHVDVIPDWTDPVPCRLCSRRSGGPDAGRVGPDSTTEPARLELMALHHSMYKFGNLGRPAPRRLDLRMHGTSAGRNYVPALAPSIKKELLSQCSQPPGTQ